MLRGESVTCYSVYGRSVSVKKHYCERFSLYVKIVATLNPRGQLVETCLSRNAEKCRECDFNSSMHIQETKKERDRR